MAVIQQLLQQDLISLTEYDDFMKFEDSQYEREAKTSGITDSPSKEEESGIEISESSEASVSNQPDDIKVSYTRTPTYQNHSIYHVHQMLFYLGLTRQTAKGK